MNLILAAAVSLGVMFAGPAAYAGERTEVQLAQLQRIAHTSIESQIFPPDVVVEHARRIKLKPAQRDEIIELVRTHQDHLTTKQLELVEIKGELLEELDQHPIDEAGTVTIMKRLLTAEAKVKAAHMGLVIRVRNLLTEDQVDILRKMRRNSLKSEH